MPRARRSLSRRSGLLRLLAGAMLLGSMSAPAARAADAAWGPEALKAFDELYGAEVRRVSGTPAKSDDLELAEQIFAAAATVKDPAMVEVMVAKASELAQRSPEGADSTLRALDLLITRMPQREAEWRRQKMAVVSRQHDSAKGEVKEKLADKLVEVTIEYAKTLEKSDAAKAVAEYRRLLPFALRVKSARTEEIREAADLLASRVAAAARVENLKKKLLDQAQDTKSAEELVKLLYLDLDRADEASQFADLFKDPMRGVVKALAKGPDGAESADQAAAAANWVYALASSGKDMQKELALTKAGQWYKGLARRSDASDNLKASAGVKFKQIETALAAIEKDKPKPKSRYIKFTGETITVEAERADALVAPIGVWPDPAASGGKVAMQALGGPADPRLGRVIFLVEVERDTDVQLVGRFKSPDYTRNELRVGVATGKKSEPDNGFRSWYIPWTATTFKDAPMYGQFTLRKGLNSVILAGEESGVGIDSITIKPANRFDR